MLKGIKYLKVLSNTKFEYSLPYYLRLLCLQKQFLYAESCISTLKVIVAMNWNTITVWRKVWYLFTLVLNNSNKIYTN